MITIRLTKRELWLLMNGFSASFTETAEDKDTLELAQISQKLDDAYRGVPKKGKVK